MYLVITISDNTHIKCVIVAESYVGQHCLKTFLFSALSSPFSQQGRGLPLALLESCRTEGKVFGNFPPLCHMGLRASLPVDQRIMFSAYGRYYII